MKLTTVLYIIPYLKRARPFPLLSSGCPNSFVTIAKFLTQISLHGAEFVEGPVWVSAPSVFAELRAVVPVVVVVVAAPPE